MNQSARPVSRFKLSDDPAVGVKDGHSGFVDKKVQLAESAFQSQRPTSLLEIVNSAMQSSGLSGDAPESYRNISGQKTVVTEHLSSSARADHFADQNSHNRNNVSRYNVGEMALKSGLSHFGRKHEIEKFLLEGKHSAKSSAYKLSHEERSDQKLFADHQEIYRREEFNGSNFKSARVSDSGISLDLGSAVKSQNYVSAGKRIQLSDSQDSKRSGSKIRAQIEHDPKVVATFVGQPHVINEIKGKAVVVDVRELDSTIKSEIVTFGSKRTVGERELAREVVSKITPKGKSHSREIELIQREKIIEIIKEKPVMQERIVDVIYDVVIDVPIERTFEQEKIIEVIMEKEIEKIVEIPVEEIYEIPIEKIIEVPVEVIKRVDMPYETIVEKPYPVTKENINYVRNYIDIDEKEVHKYPHLEKDKLTVDVREEQVVVEKPIYVDNVVENIKHVEVKKVVEVPVEELRFKKSITTIERPVPVEKVIEKLVEVPVENEVLVHVEKVREQLVKVENRVEKKVPVEKIIEVDVDIEVDVPVVRNTLFENLVEQPVEYTVPMHVIYEEINEINRNEINRRSLALEKFTAHPRDRVCKSVRASIKKQKVEVPQQVDVMVSVPIEAPIIRRVNRYREKPTERIVERPIFIQRNVEKAVEVEVVREVPVEIEIENIRTVEKIVEVPVHYDAVIEKEVEVIVEKPVEVKVEKTIEVPFEIKVAKPIFVERIVEEFYDIPVESTDIVQQDLPEEFTETEDQELQIKIRRLEAEIDQQSELNTRLQMDMHRSTAEVAKLRASSRSNELSTHLDLLAQLMKLTSQVRNAEQEHHILLTQTNSQTVVETKVTVNPHGQKLINKLEKSLKENAGLVEHVVSKDRKVKALLGPSLVQ